VKRKKERWEKNEEKRRETTKNKMSLGTTEKNSSVQI
jgi:hypothetical protein